jgi:hypothetical protein
VTVVEKTDEHVVLDLPSDPHDCSRVVPEDLIDIGDESWNWFAWDLEKKQPRAPHKTGGYAGPVQWGRDNVSWDGGRVGSRFTDILEALDGEVNGYIDSQWRWPDGDGPDELDEDPRPLYPMCIVPHEDFQADPPLLFVDFDDVIEVRDDGTGMLTREVWDIIERLGGYGEVSTSMSGVHVLVRGRLPADLDAKKVIEDLNGKGQIEMYGVPGEGRIVGTTWMHIETTPRDAVPAAQNVIEELIDEYVDDSEKLSKEEQVKAVLERRETRVQGDNSGSNGSAYYNLDPVPIANTGAFTKHARNGQGPHPVHGGTSTPDSVSTNFGVDSMNGWKCWAHDDGGGALHLIAVMEGIRQCGNASGLMQDPVDALTVCLAARDQYSTGLDDESPPTAALKGVCDVMNLDYPDDGQLSTAKYRAAHDLWDEMQYTGGDGQ